MESSPPDYDLNDYNCVDFANDMIKAAGLPGDVDTYLTEAQKADMNGARFYNDWVYGGVERPSMVDPLADHAATFNRMINGAKYNSLQSELLREGVSQNLLDEIERGLAYQRQPEAGRVNPSLGAAIMHGIEGHDLLSNPLPGGFSALEKVASVRAQNVYERTGSVVEAAQAAVDGVREAQNYNGPSREVSPEDSMTPSQNRAQLAMNTKVLKARRASLSDGGAVRAGVGAAPAAPATSATRAGAQRLYEQKAASLHPDPVAARRAVRTTLPEQVSLPDFSNLFNNAVDGLQSVLGVKAAVARAVAPSRGQLESAKIAGLVMDQPMADKVMTSKAYRTKTDLLNAFATKATQSFYGAAYADDNPSAPKRRSALEEPGRKAQVESLEQKQARETQARYAAAYAEIDRENRQRDKDEAAQNKQREAAAAAEVKRVRETAAMEDVGATPGALPTETVQVAKVDKLGDNAVSAAQAAQGGRQTGMLSTVNASQEVRANAASPEAETKAVAARRASDSNGRAQGTPARTMDEESLYGETSTAGSLGTAGKFDGSGKYISGTNSRGMRTGGVGLDAQGREIGAYGQFTRDIIGRTGRDASSNTRVICTELVRQGRMAPSLQRLDIAFTLRKLSPATVRGYHFWAVPYVHLMRRSTLATALIDPIATWRALEIAYLLGERDRPHWRGKLVRGVMEPLCWLIGWTIEALPGDADRFYPSRVTGRQTKTPTL